MPCKTGQPDLADSDFALSQLIDPILVATALLAGGRTALRLDSMQSADGQSVGYLGNLVLTVSNTQGREQKDETFSGFAKCVHDVVRIREVEGPATATFDILLRSGRILTGFRLWLSDLSASPWVISAEGRGPFIRISPAGVEERSVAPFYGVAELRAGLLLGETVLRVAKQGWF